MELNQLAYQVHKRCNSIVQAEKYYSVHGCSILHIPLQMDAVPLEDSLVNYNERFFVFESQIGLTHQYVFSFHQGRFKLCEFDENCFKYYDSPQLNDPLSNNLVLFIVQELKFNSGSECIHLSPMLISLMNYLNRKQEEFIQFENDKIPGITPYRIKQIERYIKNRIDCCITTLELAQLCDLSQYHFIRMFKRTTGQTPHQFIIQLKMEKAKELLSSNKSIIQIGFATGFDNPSHFTQVFKNFFGITPLKFRRQVPL